MGICEGRDKNRDTAEAESEANQGNVVCPASHAHARVAEEWAKIVTINPTLMAAAMRRQRSSPGDPGTGDKDNDAKRDEVKEDVE